MIKTIDLSAWEDRLKDQCPLFEQRVFKTIPDDNLGIDQHESPLLFVYQLSDQSAVSSESGKAIRQQNTPLIACEIVIRRSASLNDRFSAADADLLRQCRNELLTALIGWEAPDCNRKTYHVNGKLTAKTDRLIKHVDAFSNQIKFVASN